MLLGCRPHFLGIDDGVGHRQIAEIGEAVKGKEVGVVGTASAAETIVAACANGGDDIVSFEQPIGVLKAVVSDLPFVDEEATDFPVAKVLGAHQGQRVARGRCFGFTCMAWHDRIGQGPVGPAPGIEAD